MINERKLSENELDQRFAAVKGLLKNKRNLVKKYGKDAEKVMYGIATKQAKKKVENMNLDKIKGMVEDALTGQIEEANPFVLAADAARDAGKKEFEFPKGSGKMHPVKLKQDIDEEEVEELFGSSIFDDEDEEKVLGVSVKEGSSKYDSCIDVVKKWLGDGPQGKAVQNYLEANRKLITRDMMSADFDSMNENQEVTENRDEAIEDLKFLLQSLEAKSDEARNIVQDIDPNEADRLDRYGAFNFGFSDNKYDTTLQSFYQELTGEDGEIYENVDKVAGGIPYKVEGGKAIISEPLDDATKERIIKRCEDAGYHCAPNQAGGVTITLKKGMYEEEAGEQDKVASNIQKALNKHGKDDSKKHQILRARKALNKGDMATAKKIVGRYLEEIKEHDLEVGHEDNEPQMLKADLYRIAKYAGELYKMLDAYDDMPNDVDFPHWWQAKVIKARDYMVGAKHYLDGEEKVDQIDTMMDGNMEEADNSDYAMKIRAMRNKKPSPKPSKVKPNAKLDALKKRRAQVMRDMEQEAEMEGGEVADRYGDELNKIDMAISKLSEGDIELSKDQMDKLHDKGSVNVGGNKILYKVTKEILAKYKK